MKIVDELFWKYVLKQPKVRRFLTSCLYRNGNATIDLFGAKFEIHMRKDSFIYRAYLRSKSLNIFRHELPQILSLALLLRPNDLFLDIGSNVGLHAALYLRLANVYPGFKVCAFEPNPDTYLRLQQTMNYVGQNTCIFNKGVSNENGKLEFVSGAGSSEFGRPNHSGWQVENERTVVECVRLDSLEELYKHPGDLVAKIDVEGHEWEVIDGARVLLESGRLKLLLIDGFSDARIPTRLIGLGFRIFDAYTLKPLSQPIQNTAIIAIHETRVSC